MMMKEAARKTSESRNEFVTSRSESAGRRSSATPLVDRVRRASRLIQYESAEISRPARLRWTARADRSEPYVGVTPSDSAARDSPALHSLKRVTAP